MLFVKFMTKVKDDVMFVCKLGGVCKSKCKVHILVGKETFIMTRGGLIALLLHGRYSCKYGG